MQAFVAVIGGRNAGKSTIIKSLTGCQFSNTRDLVLDDATSRSIYVIASSPQEAGMSLAKLKGILSSVRRNTKCNGIVCALQPTVPTRRLSIEVILSEAFAHGFVVFPYVLDPSRSGPTGLVTRVAARMPHGVRAIHALDARRFAHINAATINSHSQIAS
jgi:ABC-type cobalamin/Fe3+-siderophores transport system ATPase subunit